MKKKNQYKALKIIYNTNESYDELFIGSNEVSIHQKHLHFSHRNMQKCSRYKSRFYEPIFYDERNAL